MSTADRLAVAWRLVIGGALLLFALGTYLGHVALADDPDHTVVRLDVDHTPTPGTLHHAGQ